LLVNPLKNDRVDEQQRFSLASIARLRLVMLMMIDYRDAIPIYLIVV
jgi:hypothetical protein